MHKSIDGTPASKVITRITSDQFTEQMAELDKHLEAINEREKIEKEFKQHCVDYAEAKNMQVAEGLATIIGLCDFAVSRCKSDRKRIEEEIENLQEIWDDQVKEDQEAAKSSPSAVE